MGTSTSSSLLPFSSHNKLALVVLRIGMGEPYRLAELLR